MRATPRELPKPGGTVETARGAPVDAAQLAEDYARLGSLDRLGAVYGMSRPTMRALLVKLGIRIQTNHDRAEKPKSAAWREKQRLSNWENPVWIEKQRARWLERLPGMRALATNSPLERLLQGALLSAGISFGTQRLKLGRYLVDIEVDQAPVIIEADGAMHVRTRRRDAERDAALVAAGFRVFRFQGQAICRDPSACIAQVIAQVGLVPDCEPRADIRNGMVGPDNPRWKGGKPAWTCEACGSIFSAYARKNSQPRRTCSKQCQAIWQRQHLSRRWTESGRRETASEVMRKQWADPVTGLARRQAMIQSALTGDRKT